jgi:antitoxin component YwqK of YwqJK toxin-antitoxin module
MNDEEAVESVETYDNGNPKLRGWLLDGEMHGAWSFFRRDGSLMRTAPSSGAARVGAWRTYDREGVVVKETVYPD